MHTGKTTPQIRGAFLVIAATMMLAGCGSHGENSSADSRAQAQAIVQQARQNAMRQAALSHNQRPAGTPTSRTNPYGGHP